MSSLFLCVFFCEDFFCFFSVEQRTATVKANFHDYTISATWRWIKVDGFVEMSTIEIPKKGGTCSSCFFGGIEIPKFRSFVPLPRKIPENFKNQFFSNDERAGEQSVAAQTSDSEGLAKGQPSSPLHHRC